MKTEIRLIEYSNKSEERAHLFDKPSFQPLPGKYMKEIKQNSFEFSMETIFSLWAIENSKWKISVTASQCVLSLKGLPGGQTALEV